MRKTKSLADAEKRGRLDRTRWTWLKNRANSTEKYKQKWELMVLEWRVTGMAYEIKVVLQGIYEWQAVGEAGKLFLNCCAWAHSIQGKTGELLQPLARAARMIEGHLDGFLAHSTRCLTTAFIEGLNILFSAVKRRARGYRTEEYMTAMLYFVAGKLTLSFY